MDYWCSFFLAVLIFGILASISSVEVISAASYSDNPHSSGRLGVHRGRITRIDDGTGTISNESGPGAGEISTNAAKTPRNQNGMLAKILRVAYDRQNVEIDEDGNRENTTGEGDMKEVEGGSVNRILPRGLDRDPYTQMARIYESSSREAFPGSRLVARGPRDRHPRACASCRRIQRRPVYSSHEDDIHESSMDHDTYHRLASDRRRYFNRERQDGIYYRVNDWESDELTDTPAQWGSYQERREHYDDDYVPYRRPPQFGTNRGLFRSFHGNNYMLPSRVFDAVEDLIEDSSMFYVTFYCQPKFGKYLCKLQCAKRDERMTGSCEAGYCNCMLKWEKKMRKEMSKLFMAAMQGYDTDCSDYKKAKHCKRFCKALTPDKAFTGLCKDTHCQCITYPKTPEKKKNACTKAIKQLKKIEDKALLYLGFKPKALSSLGAAAEKQVNEAAEEAIQKFKSNNSIDGCTEEDIQNLRGILANLSQGLSLVKDYSQLGRASGTNSGTASGTNSGTNPGTPPRTASTAQLVTSSGAAVCTRGGCSHSPCQANP